MCLFPKLVKNPKYKANKKNGGNIPYLKDDRVFFVPIGCGECIECCKQKSNNWRVRLLEDIKEFKNGKFITLTFSNESYSDLYNLCKGEGYIKDNNIATLAVRRFLERYRKEHKKSLRHWLITELGHNGTENIHLHGIVWSDDINNVEKHWKYGYVWKGKRNKFGTLDNYVNARTINYIIKYVTKKDILHKSYKPIILCSSGIGKSYTNRSDFKRHVFKKGETIEYYTNAQGFKMGLPIYYRNKAFNDDERENLWIEKLDKKERYILGVKIDVSKGDEVYLSALKHAQQENINKGFGNGEKDFDRDQYERELRILKQKERLKF